ncbi:MAG: hypothetical protein RJB66_988 [Pseudomonadota bacterium]
MRTFFLSTLLILVAPLSHALTQFDIQPLSIKTKYQVMGVQAGPQAQKAIIYTGDQAEQVAQKAGFTINKHRQMLVMTGPEVDSLVGSSIGATYSVGKLVLITSANFVSAAINMTYNILAVGAGVVWLGVSTAATIGKTVVYFTLKGLQGSFYLITGTGVFLVKASQRIVVGTLKFICEIPNYFGLGFFACH